MHSSRVVWGLYNAIWYLWLSWVRLDFNIRGKWCQWLLTFKKVAHKLNTGNWLVKTGNVISLLQCQFYCGTINRLSGVIEQVPQLIRFRYSYEQQIKVKCRVITNNFTENEIKIARELTWVSTCNVRMCVKTNKCQCRESNSWYFKSMTLIMPSEYLHHFLEMRVLCLLHVLERVQEG